MLPLGPLADDAAVEFLLTVGVVSDHVQAITRIALGHPLVLRTRGPGRRGEHRGRGEQPTRVVDAMAQAFRAGLDDDGRRLLDAASVPRRVTRGVLEAMLSAHPTPTMHLNVWLRSTSSSRPMRAYGFTMQCRPRYRPGCAPVDPDRFRRLRGAAWRHLQAETHRTGASELHRSTADLLFLIDNPFVREAVFPTTSHAFSVERCRPDDLDALRALWHEYDTPEGAAALDAWLRLRPDAVRSIRDRTAVVVGC